MVLGKTKGFRRMFWGVNVEDIRGTLRRIFFSANVVNDRVICVNSQILLVRGAWLGDEGG